MRRALAGALIVVTAVLTPLPAAADEEGSITVGVTIAPRTTDGLVATGTDAAPLLAFAVVLALMGGATIAGSRHRSPRAARPGSPRP